MSRVVTLIDARHTGKTHLATALAREVVLKGMRARFYSVVDLVNQLDAEKREGRAGRLANRLLNQNAIVLDELGYLPFAHDGGALLFHLISKLYERVSLIVTTNLSFGEWSNVFGDAKMNDSAARSAHPPLRHHRNRQRQLPVQEAKIAPLPLVNFGRRLLVNFGRRLTLGCHGRVATGGELDALTRVYMRFVRDRNAAGRKGPVDSREPADRALLHIARESYVERVLEYAEDAEFITDKHPGNAPLVGFMRVLFPDAPIILCRREPMATCWSIYSSFLPSATACFRTFEGLALYHRAHDRLMEFWRGTVSAPVVELAYEDLVSDPAARIPALVARCGLPWEDRCLHPEESKAPVNTASVDQVRRPIHRESIDHYRRYDEYLGDLREALAASRDS